MTWGRCPNRTLDLEFETLAPGLLPAGRHRELHHERGVHAHHRVQAHDGPRPAGVTTILREYSKAYEPGSGQTPYYAILEPANKELYGRYRDRVADIVNFHTAGRLAEYRYYDMDAVVARALQLADQLCDNNAI